MGYRSATFLYRFRLRPGHRFLPERPAPGWKRHTANEPVLSFLLCRGATVAVGWFCYPSEWPSRRRLGPDGRVARGHIEPVSDPRVEGAAFHRPLHDVHIQDQITDLLLQPGDLLVLERILVLRVGPQVRGLELLPGPRSPPV